GGFDPAPLPDDVISLLGAEASKEGATLAIMTDETSLGALAGAVQAGEYALRLDVGRAREQAKWAPPPGSRRRSGVPTSAYPVTPEPTEPSFPGRDFAHGQGWGSAAAETSAVPRSAGLVCLLTTKTDRQEDWIYAGQALQRVLLAARSHGVAAALHTQPLEVAELRSFITAFLSEGHYPQMIMRLGSTEETSVSVRRSLDEVLLWRSRAARQSGGIAFDRPRHAARPAAAPAELATDDGDDLDAVFAEHGVCLHVALVSEHHTGSHGQVVGSVIPLFALSRAHVLVGGQHGHLFHLECFGQASPQVSISRDGQARAAAIAGRQRPRAQMPVQIGVADERRPVDHGQDRVEVHHRPAGWQLDCDHPARLPGAQQRAGEQ